MTDQQPPPPPPPPPGDPAVGEQVGKANERAAAAAGWQGGGTIWNEPVLVVNQKAKLIELSNEYKIFDQNGTQIGAVAQPGQSGLRKLFRLVSSFDQFLTHRLTVTDSAGTPQMQLTRPAKFMKSKVIVSRPDGAEVGRIVQENVFGKKRFALEAGGHTYGSVNAENWRSWDFSVQDHAGTEVARITKTWEGLAKAAFTTADNYVVHIHRPLDDPLRWLVIASAVGVDTALKQDAGGFN